MLRKKLSPILTTRYNIVNTGLDKKSEHQLRKINKIVGKGLIYVPQIIMIMISGDSGEESVFTMLHNNAHLNVSSLFDEARNRDPKHDSLTLVKGTLGSYPAAYLYVKEKDIPELVERLQTIRSNDDYVKLLDKFAIRRTSPDFWSFSDKVHHWYRQSQPIEFGLLDYNRFENR